MTRHNSLLNEEGLGKMLTAKMSPGMSGDYFIFHLQKLSVADW